MVERIDNLNFENEEEIKQEIGDETIYFSDKIQKIRNGLFNKHQDRNFLITDKAIYNLKGKKVKRRIEKEKIKGITISKISDQFILHGNSEEYDYLFISTKRFQIIKVLQTLFNEITNKYLILTIKNEKELKKYIVGKDERKKQATLFKLDPKDFMSVREYIESNGSMSINTHPNTYKLESEFLRNKKYKGDESLDNFEIICLIGKGNTSNVYLANYSGQNVALKVFDKVFLYQNNLIDKILLEKNILCSFQEEKFLCHMKFYFTTDTKIVFVLPFYPGGDLFNFLQNHGPFDEETTAFYITQVAYIISFLHSKNILYRDVKPENFLIDENGYLVLIDFGSCKIFEEKCELSSSFCGSIDYVSPEMISGEGHNLMTDWWSVGILTYELLFGVPPFHGSSTERTLDLISNSIISYDSKIHITSVTKDFITKLLNKKIKERIGQGGFQEITKHHFFQGCSYNNIVNQKITPNAMPEINEDYTNNFDKMFINSNIEDFEQSSDPSLFDDCAHLFKEFEK